MKLWEVLKTMKPGDNYTSVNLDLQVRLDEYGCYYFRSYDRVRQFSVDSERDWMPMVGYVNFDTALEAYMNGHKVTFEVAGFRQSFGDKTMAELRKYSGCKFYIEEV